MINRLIKSLDYLGGKYIYIAICVFIMIIFVGTSFGIDRTHSKAASVGTTEEAALTLSKVTLNGITFSVPGYYEESSKSKEQIGYNSVDGYEFAYLTISVSYDDEDSVSYKMLEEETNAGLMTEAIENSYFENSKVNNIVKYKNHYYQGFIYECTANWENQDIEFCVYCFPIEESNSWGMFTFANFADSESGYYEDYLEILKSIQPAN